jgi:hypothetical protein
MSAVFMTQGNLAKPLKLKKARKDAVFPFFEKFSRKETAAFFVCFLNGKTKEESEATAMDKKSVVVLFQSVSKRFKLFRFFEALFERLRWQAIFRFYFRFSRSRTPFLSKIIAFRKSPQIWPSCGIAIKKASSRHDLLVLRLMVPGTGLEPVWI